MKNLALVTGGTRGIGKEIAVSLKDAGYDVAVTCFKSQDSAATFTSDTGIEVFGWDVSDFEQCHSGIQKIEDKFGRSVDILINNAGITADRMMHKMTFDFWDRVIRTNLNSVFNMCHAVINPMREKNYGRIINISSVNGLKGQIGQTNYSAAKAGIIGFTKALAQESSDKGITVNAIAPGYVDTQMTSIIKEEIKNEILKTIPIKRFANPKEIGQVVKFLIDQPYITGETININGGQYMS